MTTSETPVSPSLANLPQPTKFDVPPTEFNAVAWTNAVLSSSSSPPIPLLLDLLQDHIRDTHVVLDRSLKKALSAVPWVVRETDKVRQRANLLRAGVDGVGQRVEGVETGVASSVTTIADADTIVRRVQRATELLTQAVEAERLLARLDALLASSAADGSDLVSAADVVSKLRTTLAPLKPIAELGDRFNQLDDADRKLEALAAPQLKKALESRNTQAAINARIVFDHAGRDHAFQTQYVALRGDQVKKHWGAAWEARGDDGISDEHKTAVSGEPGDFAGAAAEVALTRFYGSLFDMIRTEADWLRVAFPDLREQLLPSLICEAVGNLSNPSPHTSVSLSTSTSDAFAVVHAIANRLFGVALASIKSAAKVARLFLPDNFAEMTSVKGEESCEVLMDTIVNAITALLIPFREFWKTMNQIAVIQSRTRAAAIELSTMKASAESIDGDNLSSRVITVANLPKYRPPLSDIAKDIENCTREALAIQDSLLTQLNHRTCGVGINAMKQTTDTVSTVLSDRLLKVLQLPVSEKDSSEDEWARISGALRLLMASSALKRSWDARKESLFAIAVGTATPVLEIASLVRGAQVKRVEQFLSQSECDDPQEAAVIWEVVRDEKLAPKVVAEFESLDSANDFEKLITAIHRLVYDTMFAGVKKRFESFGNQNVWSSDSSDGETSILGFSSSPLGYATEVADYLMTVPQQLEPFVPDEEDAKHATPHSLYVYSKGSLAFSENSIRGAAGNERLAQIASGQGISEDLEREVEQESTNVSFAGMWISLLAIGTMELYVEKICTIQKMSYAGSRQLATDADYICNVIASLGVAPTAEMSLVCRLLECGADTGSLKEVAMEFPNVEHKKLIRKVAAVRGISVTI